MPAQTAQWTVKKAKQPWNSFFGARKSWKKHPENFVAMPKPPKYKNKDGEFILIFTNQQCSIDNGILIFPGIMGMEVKTRLTDVNLGEARVIPQGTGYTVEIVYIREIADLIGEGPHRVMGINIGVRNLVTSGNNISEEGLAVRAGLPKSINQFFNKKLAEYRSINDIQGNGRRKTRRINKLFLKRNRKVKDVMHGISRAIVAYAKSMGIDTIVIGHNEGWKQPANIGKSNNQNFVQLPFNTLIQQIKYKA